MPRISVIIPAYKAMAYLPETLASALAQDADDVEVLVIDDGSPDNVREWFATQTDARARLISRPNGGLSAARNTGIREAKGAYLAFLDADDLWKPAKLRLQAAVLDARPEVGLVNCWVALIDEHGRSKGRQIRNPERGRVWSVMVERNIVECGSVPLIRRECFERVGGFDETIVSPDRDMWLRIAAEYEVELVPDALVYYRHHSLSQSKNWRALLESTHIVNDRALAANPDRLSPNALATLRRKSYGVAYLRLAWKPLQGTALDHTSFAELTRKALSYDKSLLFSREFAKLMLAGTLTGALGANRYRRFLSTVGRIRSGGRERQA